MQIKKSLRFLLISLCIMSVHNVVFAGYKEVAENCPNYYDESANKYIKFTSSNTCGTCNTLGYELVLVKSGSDVFKYCLNSGNSDFWNLMSSSTNNSACDRDGQGVFFEPSSEPGLNLLSGIAKCGTCAEKNRYALAYKDVKHQSGLAKVYDVYNLNECVTCAGTDYQGYYTKNGECKPCPDGYATEGSGRNSRDDSDTSLEGRCGLCIADGWGNPDGNSRDCVQCPNGKIAKERHSVQEDPISHTDVKTRNHNICIAKSACTGTKYGIIENGGVEICAMCSEHGMEVQATSSGWNKCVKPNACPPSGAYQSLGDALSNAIQDEKNNYNNDPAHAMRSCQDGTTTKYYIGMCTGTDDIIYLKRESNVIYKFCGKISDLNENFVDTTYTTSDTPSVTFHYASCHVEGTVQKGVYWDNNELKCTTTKPNNLYLLKYSDRSEGGLFRIFKLDEWVNCRGDKYAGYGVASNSCMKCASYQASIFDDDNEDAPNVCKACNNSIGGIYGFNSVPSEDRMSCQTCIGKKVVNQTFDACDDSCGTNQVPLPDNSGCDDCPEGSVSEDNLSCHCTGTNVKMPRDEYPTNRVYFTCQSDCDVGYAAFYKSGTDYQSYGICKKCSDNTDASQQFYQPGVGPNGKRACVASCDTMAGYGETAEGSKICVKCADQGKVVKNGVCSNDGCDTYQVKDSNGVCQYCWEKYGQNYVYDDDDGNDDAKDSIFRCIPSSACATNNNTDKFSRFIIKREHESGSKYNLTVLLSGDYTTTNLPAQEPQTDKKIYICHSCNLGQDVRKDNDGKITKNIYNSTASMCSDCAGKEWFDPSQNVGSRCSECPNNFVCNGTDRKACPFGFATNAQNQNKCVQIMYSGEDSSTLGLIKKTGTGNNVVRSLVNPANDFKDAENEYRGFDNADNIEEIGKYYVETCDGIDENGQALNAIGVRLEADQVYKPSEYTDSWLDKMTTTHIENGRFVNIYICKKCDTGYDASGKTCYCGYKSNESDGYGLMGTNCIKCPNGRTADGTTGAYNYHCNACAEGTGLNSNNECKNCNDRNAPSYLGYCRTFEQLQEILGDDANKYYPLNADNGGFKWGECPHYIEGKNGVCCYGGKAFKCAIGTISKPGMACTNQPVNANDLGSCFIKCSITKTAKTTSAAGAYYSVNPADYDNQEDVGIAGKMCTTNREPELFCPWGLGDLANSTSIYPGAQKRANNADQCFRVPEKMSTMYGFSYINYNKDNSANLPEIETEQ